MSKIDRSRSAKEHNWMLLEQHYKHYKKIDFRYWDRKAKHAIRRIAKLKTEKSKYTYYLELYTDYIQLFEVAMANMLAMVSGKLFEYLFINSSDLRKMTCELFVDSTNKEDPMIDRWIRELVFQRAIFGQYIMDNPEQKIKQYKAMFNEAAKDYLKDYQLLNAFKHGFRTSVSGKGVLAISSNSSTKPKPHSYVVGQYTSGITYLSSETKKLNGGKTKIIFENKINFNYQRVYKKILYLSNALENSRQAILYVAKPKGVGRQRVCETLKVTDSIAHQAYSDVFRLKTPIYDLKQPKPKQ